MHCATDRRILRYYAKQISPTHLRVWIVVSSIHLHHFEFRDYLGQTISSGTDQGNLKTHNLTKNSCKTQNFQIFNSGCIHKFTLLGTNIPLTKTLLKMICPFPRWETLVPWRVYCFFPIQCQLFQQAAMAEQKLASFMESLDISTQVLAVVPRFFGER